MKRGDLVATISATGTIEPVEVVDVGAQAGRISSIGTAKRRQDSIAKETRLTNGRHITDE